MGIVHRVFSVLKPPWKKTSCPASWGHSVFIAASHTGSQKEKGVWNWTNKECWRGNAVQVVWVCEKKWACGIPSETVTSPAPVLPRLLICLMAWPATFLLSPRTWALCWKGHYMNILQICLMWKNVKIGQATNPVIVALFCHNNLKMDKQEQHSWPMAWTDNYGCSQPVEHFLVSFALASMVSWVRRYILRAIHAIWAFASWVAKCFLESDLPWRKTFINQPGDVDKPGGR